MKHSSHDKSSYLHSISHKRINPPGVTAEIGLPQLIEEVFLSYNAGRLREACKLFTTKMLADDATVGLSLSGALTPAGLGASCLVPLVEAGFLDWIISTGANLYHDTHFALGMEMHQARPGLDDLKLREEQVIRIYDVIFHYDNLLGTDEFYRTLCRTEPFQKTMGTAEFHYLVGKYLAEREEQTGRKGRSLLAAAYRCGVPVYTSSPGDSSIGMNLAALQLEGSALRIDPLRDVNQTAAIVWDASSGKRMLTFDMHEDRVSSVAFSPDGTRIATASDDKTIRVWDAATGKEVLPPCRHHGVVLSANFSSNGARLAGASWSSSDWVKTWPTQNDQ